MCQFFFLKKGLASYALTLIFYFSFAVGVEIMAACLISYDCSCLAEELELLSTAPGQCGMAAARGMNIG